MKNYLYIFLICSLSLILGCTGSKSLYKKGAQLEEQGLYRDAADFYYNSLSRNTKNVEARVGLNQTGQKVLNDYLDEFSRTRAMENHKEAVYMYRDAKDYESKLKRLNVVLNVPAHYQEDYKNSENIYLSSIYEEGSELLASKKFDEANALFKEVFSINPQFKDTEELKNISRNEPIYLAASADFDKGEFRSAHQRYTDILKVDQNYKDVNQKMNECIELGKFIVAILPFENSSGKRGVDQRIAAYVLNDLLSINDPFLKIIERESLDLILEEQRRGLSGMIDESTAVELGRLLGAKAIVTGNVLSYKEIPGRLKYNIKKGYEAYQVKVYDKVQEKETMITKYKPVEYKEYYNANEVIVSFQYKMISMETGEILFSQIVDKNNKSDVYYATYEGELTSLYPADANNGVNTNNREKQTLTALLRADRNVEPIEQVATKAFGSIADDVSKSIENYLKTY